MADDTNQTDQMNEDTQPTYPVRPPGMTAPVVVNVLPALPGEIEAGEIVLGIEGVKELVYVRDAEEITLGRGATTQRNRHVFVALQGPDESGKGVSRKHASLYVSHDGLYIKDHNSTNGTWLNGTKIPPETRQTIAHRDVIKLGHLRVVVGFKFNPPVATERIRLTQSKSMQKYPGLGPDGITPECMSGEIGPLLEALSYMQEIRSVSSAVKPVTVVSIPAVGLRHIVMEVTPVREAVMAINKHIRPLRMLHEGNIISVRATEEGTLLDLWQMQLMLHEETLPEAMLKLVDGLVTTIRDQYNLTRSNTLRAAVAMLLFTRFDVEMDNRRTRDL